MGDEDAQARELEARARVLEERIQNARRHRREPPPPRAWVPFTVPFMLLAAGGLVGYGLIHRADVEKSEARRCENGTMSLCLAAAYNLAHAHYRERDSKRAERLYRQACEAGLGAACSRLAERDDKMWLRACLQGDARACTRFAGESSALRTELGEDEGRKLAAWKLACDGGDAEGCEHLAEEIGNDPYHAQGESLYLKLLQRGCDLGRGKSCKLIGDSLMYRKDKESAQKMYQLACDKKYQSACDKLKQQRVEQEKL